MLEGEGGGVLLKYLGGKDNLGAFAKTYILNYLGYLRHLLKNGNFHAIHQLISFMISRLAFAGVCL